MNSHATTALQNKVVALENRMHALEAFVMAALGGEVKTTNQIDTIEAIKTYLAKVEIADLPEPTVNFLLDRLTVDWRHLAKINGWAITLRLLREGYSVPEARRHLK